MTEPSKDFDSDGTVEESISSSFIRKALEVKEKVDGFTKKLPGQYVIREEAFSPCVTFGEDDYFDLSTRGHKLPGEGDQGIDLMFHPGTHYLGGKSLGTDNPFTLTVGTTTERGLNEKVVEYRESNDVPKILTWIAVKTRYVFASDGKIQKFTCVPKDLPDERAPFGQGTYNKYLVSDMNPGDYELIGGALAQCLKDIDELTSSPNIEFKPFEDDE